jgi:hypothetical protein
MTRMNFVLERLSVLVIMQDTTPTFCEHPFRVSKQLPTAARADMLSLDLFYKGSKGDILDPARRRKFRYAVLQPGRSSSEWETMTKYLGREPNTEAFYRELG